MADFEDRELAFERKYANDQETLFRIEARACKLLGLWVAQEMGLQGDAAATYAGDLVSHNLKEPGLNDVISKVKADLSAKGKSGDTAEDMLLRFLKDAEGQIRAA